VPLNYHVCLRKYDLAKRVEFIYIPDGFCLESIRASYSFYKVRPVLYLRPAGAVPYLSRKYGQQQKRLTRQNGRELF